MSGQDAHPHVPSDPFTPHPQQDRPPASAAAVSPVPIDIDVDDNTSATATTPTATMPTFEELQTLAAAQSAQLAQANEIVQQQQQQMVDAQAAFDSQQRQLEESARQMEQQRQTIQQLSSAFSTLTTTTASATSTPSRKKPEMPPFDQQNVLIWLKRLQAAYDRANVTLAKDKFSFLESTFDTSFNPIINDFLFNSNNTDDNWNEFVAYMKLEYGPTRRQKARKLIGDLPRTGMKPSQYMAWMEEEVRDVTLDDVKKEHLLKSIPPRIREILGKNVESKTAKEVAKLADDYFDSQGRPLEKSATTISHVDSQQTSAATSSAPSFTSPFDDSNTEVNFVKKSNFKGRQRSQSRPRFSNNGRQNSNASSSTATSAATSSSRQQQNSNGLCRFHRMFGDNATKCVSDCPRHSSFLSSQQKMQQQGNATGGRRL